MKKSLLYYFTLLMLFSFSASLNGQYNRLGGEKINQAHLESYQRIVAGYTYYLELKNGKIYASGKNDKGQLGNGTNTDVTQAVQIGVETNWIFVSAGDSHSFGIKADGTLWAWGNNERGQLGTGSTENSNVPIQVGTDRNWTSVSAGSSHTLALKSNGTLWSWGNNYQGQLGNGTTGGYTDANPYPVQVGTDTNWTAISSGYNHSLALKANGTLWAWGENILGQVGTGETSTQGISTPTQIMTESKWRNISAGGFFSTAIKTDGTLWVWGDNYYGQIANGNTNTTPNPTQVGAELWKSVEAGRTHILAGKTDGTVWAWGDVNGSQSNSATSPEIIAGIKGITQFTAGTSTSYVINSNGEMYVWGLNNLGQLGLGNAESPISQPKLNSSKNNEIVMVASGHGFSTVVLYSSGKMKAWGYNSDYNLGTGTNDGKNAPVELPLVGNNNISVSTGFGHTLALKDDGTAWGWGDNESGAVGTGSGNNHEITPVQIGDNNDWLGIISGSFASAGIKVDGTLWTWGSNFNGTIGNGTTSSVTRPQRVGSETDRWVSVSIGGFHTIAIKEDGTLWGWGRNYTGEAGGGDNTENILLPQQIGTDNDWIALSAHTMSSFALKADGTLWAWGAAGMGQLGQPTPLPVKITTPTRIGDDLFIKAKLASWSGAGIIPTGELKVWSNFATVFNELGIGDATNHPTPTLLPEHRNIIQISAGQNHKSILKAQRTDVCMVGRNGNGEVGAGTTETSYSTYQCGIAPPSDDSITVTVSTENNVPAIISVKDGTLQLNATVLPESSNQSVNWSIQSGTENASIDSNGLVKALANGTAVARATSVEDTTAFDEISIEISGQMSTTDYLEVPVVVYPNPTEGLVYVKSEMEVESIVVVSISGQKVELSYSNYVDITPYPSGLYILKVKFKNQKSKTYKVIKK